jgi:hypothetical protein
MIIEIDDEDADHKPLDSSKFEEYIKEIGTLDSKKLVLTQRPEHVIHKDRTISHNSSRHNIDRNEYCLKIEHDYSMYLSNNRRTPLNHETLQRKPPLPSQ